MKMNYFVVGTNRMHAATRFYDALFAEEGIARWMSEGRMTLWKTDDFVFALATPFDGKSASCGNGTMVGFHVGQPTRLRECMQLQFNSARQMTVRPEKGQGEPPCIFEA